MKGTVQWAVIAALVGVVMELLVRVYMLSERETALHENVTMLREDMENMQVEINALIDRDGGAFVVQR